MIVCLGFFLLASGCANFLKPEIGAVARKEARIALAEDRGVQEGIWDTPDLRLVYSQSVVGDAFKLSGQLAFDRSVTDSFPAVARFFLYLSFIDDAGRVIDSVDITPIFSHFGTMPENLQVRLTRPRPPGSKAIVFNYFGVLRDGNSRDSNGDWGISYFPFD
jgi:hypothetical protein